MIETKKRTSIVSLMKGKSQLVNAYILLQCGKVKHENTCVELKDALVANFNEVKEADNITQITSDTNFCVSGIAKIDPHKKDSFVNALRSLQTSPNKNSRVKDVRVYLESI